MIREIFGTVPRITFRRSRNLRDEIVRSKLRKQGNICKGMKKYGKSRCKICDFVEEGDGFDGSGRKYLIKFDFNCDSAGVIYLISCKKRKMNHVGSTITTFRIRFNNHKSSFKKYEEGQRGIPGQQLYAHFL